MARDLKDVSSAREQLWYVFGGAELLRDFAPVEGPWICYEQVRASALALDRILAEHAAQAVSYSA
jgi:hypothetical protein